MPHITHELKSTTNPAYELDRRFARRRELDIELEETPFGQSASGYQVKAVRICRPHFRYDYAAHRLERTEDPTPAVLTSSDYHLIKTTLLEELRDATVVRFHDDAHAYLSTNYGPYWHDVQKFEQYSTPVPALTARAITVARERYQEFGCHRFTSVPIVIDVENRPVIFENLTIDTEEQEILASGLLADSNAFLKARANWTKKDIHNLVVAYHCVRESLPTQIAFTQIPAVTPITRNNVMNELI